MACLRPQSKLKSDILLSVCGLHYSNTRIPEAIFLLVIIRTIISTLEVNLLVAPYLLVPVVPFLACFYFVLLNTSRSLRTVRR